MPAFQTCNEIRTGNATILDPYGRILTETWVAGDDMVVAGLDASLIEVSTGRRWIVTRRPELYTSLTVPTELEQDTRTVRFDKKGRLKAENARCSHRFLERYVKTLRKAPFYIVFSDQMCYTAVAMNEPGIINREAVLVYLGGARNALQSAQYNLDGGFCGVAVNRAYYAFFYAATALLLTLDITRSRHAGVMAAFREHFVKPGIFAVQDSHAYGEAFELRNIADYETLGEMDGVQAHAAVENANRFVDHCKAHLTTEGYR